MLKRDIQSYLYKAAIVLVIVSGIPVLLASVYNINLFMNQTVGLIDAKNENELTRTGNLMERTMQQIMDFANSVAVDAPFTSMETPTEQWKAFNELNKLTNASPFISQYALYNRSEQFLILSGYGIERDPEQSPFPWVAADIPQLLPYQVALKDGVNAEGRPYASIIQKLPASNGAQNYILFKIDLDKIYSSFLQELNIDADTYNYYLTDADGKIIYHRDARLIGRSLASLPEPDSSKIAINRHKLGAFHWDLVSEVNKEKLYGDAARLKTRVFIVVYIVIAFMLVLILGGLRELYKPFQRIVSKMTESERLLRKNTLHRLILGQAAGSPDTERLAREMSPHLVVALLSAKPQPDEAAGAAEQSARIMKQTDDRLTRSFRAELFPEPNGDRIALIQLDSDDINSFLAELVLCFEEALLERTVISIGGVRSLANIHHSYVEAMYAYNIGRIYTADSGLYCYSKLPMDYENPVRAPAIEELELAIRQQNERSFTEALNVLFSGQLTVVEYNLHFYLVVSMLLRLFGQNSLSFLNELDRLISDKGIMNVTAVKQFLFAKFHSFREYADETKTYADQIRDYVAAHYTVNFSLDDMAERIGITKQHLINVCKKNYNRTPVEYVNEYRVEASKRLLADTQTKIAEVGTLAGFNSNSYFAKVFKQHTGITPSEYRELLSDRKRALQTETVDG